MIEFKVSSPELAERVKYMQEAPEAINWNIKDIFKMVLGNIERQAKHNAPVAAYMGGTLRADIKTNFNESRMEGVIYNTVEYSTYVHEGTYKMRARPYILDAIKNEKPKIDREFQKRELLKKK
jgi:HK97 gp10 family phage protein